MQGVAKKQKILMVVSDTIIGSFQKSATPPPTSPGTGNLFKIYGKHSLWSLFERTLKHINTQTFKNMLPLYECFSIKIYKEATMPIVNLSANFVSKAVCPEDKKKTNYYHKDIRGFLLECRSSGGKTYALQYRDKHNRQCQYKIGDSEDISFEKARRAAEKARSKVVLGQNPAEDKRVKRKVPTLGYFAEFHYMPFIKKDKKSWKTDASMLKNHILPKFGKQHMDKITSQAVMSFHQSMKANGYASGMANRGVKLLRYIFNLQFLGKPQELKAIRL
jgi:hypothetical protein